MLKITWKTVESTNIVLKVKSKGNYDAVASFYDRLAHVVFNGAIKRSQVDLLATIAAGASILIVGGGTGWILEDIAKLYNSGLSITYIELSAKMLARARKRDAGENKVLFVQMPVQEFCPTHKYDVVITAFLFDNFSANSQQIAFKKLHAALKPGGVWLYTDFTLSTYSPWHALLLKGMYAFFNLFCSLETNHLPGTEVLFNRFGYVKRREHRYYSNFIESVEYCKA